MENLPLDTSLAILSDDENVTSHLLAILTTAGFGSSIYTSSSLDILEQLSTHEALIEDTLFLIHSADIAKIEQWSRLLFNSSVNAPQIILISDASSLFSRSIANACNFLFLPIKKEKTAIGPKITIDGLVQAILDKIFARLNLLLDEEHRNAQATGALHLINRLNKTNAFSPVERTTIALLIGTHLSSKYSFRKNVARSALFFELLKIENHQEIIASARHLWNVQSILNGVVLGLACITSGTPVPVEIPLESWCVLSAELLLQDQSNGIDKIKQLSSLASFEIRATLNSSLSYAVQQIERWGHHAAS